MNYFTIVTGVSLPSLLLVKRRGRFQGLEGGASIYLFISPSPLSLNVSYVTQCCHERASPSDRFVPPFTGID